MLRTLFRIVAVAAGLGVAARAAAAQMHEHGCDLCAPQLSIDAGALLRSAAVLPAGTSDKTTPLVRARFEIETPAPHLGLFGTMEFTPKDGPTPTLTFGLKVWARPRYSSWNVTGGIGLTDYREGITESTPGAFVMRGWGEVGARYHTPLHELTLYGQAGMPFGGVRRVTYQVGVSHPLAPYKVHLGL